MTRITVAFLRAVMTIYRYGISPFTPLSCRYLPTCSAYAEEAVTLHGPWRGSWLALKRLSRCHPLGEHGYDPVPQPSSATEPRTLRSF